MQKLKQTRVLGSQAGFTLVESIIAGAVGLILLGGLASSISMMGNVQKSASMSQDALMIDEELSMKFKMGDQCTSALIGKSLPYSNSSSPLSMTTTLGGETVTLNDPSAGNPDVAPGLKISQLKLVGPTTPSTAINATSGGLYYESLSSIRVEVQKTVQGATTTLPMRELPIRVLTDASRKILACNIGASLARTCSESGGTWNAATSVCTPKDHCQFAGSYSMAPDNQGGYVNDLTGARTCPSGYQKIRSGSMAYTQACNNKSICNTFYATYSCVKCGDALSSETSGLVTGSVDILNNDVTDGETMVNGTTVAVNKAGAAVNPPPTPTPVPPPTPTPVPTATPVKGTGGGGGGGCFIQGSQILMWNGETKSIEDVEVGDQVVSINEDTMKPYVATVTRTLHHPAAAQRLYTVYLEDGNSFVANSVHPMYVSERRDYLQMSEIAAALHGGESLSLFTHKQTTSKIIAIKVSDAYVPVYNIHVNGLNNSGKYLDEGAGHNFIVDGVLAHNATMTQKK